MNRTQKNEHVDYLKREMIFEGGSVILADYGGLTVEEVNAVRREFRQAECEYKVVKNTLLLRALEGTDLAGLEPYLKGMTAIAYSKTDPVAPAKVAVKCAKDNDHFTVKAGYFEGVLDAQKVEALSKMPSKDELRSTLLATFIAAPQNMLRLLLAAPQRFLMVLEAKKRQLEG